MPTWTYPDWETMMEDYADLLWPTGFTDCIIGIVLQSDGTHAILMDEDKIIEKLVERDGMTREEAWEFYEYNIQGSRFAKNGPAYLIDMVEAYEDEI